MSATPAVIVVSSTRVTLREATVEEILPLREDVLIRGTQRVAPQFDGDRDETTHHFGAFADEHNLACVSFMASELDAAPAWQLRGMATHADWRGRGLGKELLAYCEQQLARGGTSHIMWCNARVAAASFYEGRGWRGIGEVFEIEGVGPHLKMRREIEIRTA